MRHTAVPAYGQAPCGGRIVAIPAPPRAEVPLPPLEPLPPPPALPTYQKPAGRSLPIVGIGGGSGGSASPPPSRPPGLDDLPPLPALHYRCEGCGKQWDVEPLPDEAI